MIVIVAFIAGLALDVVWTLCVDSIAKHRALFAANMSVLIYLCTLVSTVLIVQQYVIACIAYAIGGWIGTYFVVKAKSSRDGR
jgi:uncharacterized protein YebE (UPF0316 family)